MSEQIINIENSLAVIPSSIAGKWNVSVSFGASRSKNYERSVFLAKQAPIFHEEDNLIQATYSESPKEYLEFIKLYEMVSSWKSTYVAICGKSVDRKIVGALNYCYGDKCRSGNLDFCFGASLMTNNPFGCHRLQISSCNHPWWTFGIMDTAGIWHVDLNAIMDRIKSYSDIYHLCPSFSKKQVIKGLQELPKTINPRKDLEWEYTLSREGVEPKNAPGKFTITISLSSTPTGYPSGTEPEEDFTNRTPPSVSADGITETKKGRENETSALHLYEELSRLQKEGKITQEKKNILWNRVCEQKETAEVMRQILQLKEQGTMAASSQKDQANTFVFVAGGLFVAIILYAIFF